MEYNGEKQNGHNGGSVAMYFENTYLGEYGGDSQSKLDVKAFANSGFSEDMTHIRMAASCYTYYLQGKLSARDSFLNNYIKVEKEQAADYILKKYGKTLNYQTD